MRKVLTSSDVLFSTIVLRDVKIRTRNVERKLKKCKKKNKNKKSDTVLKKKKKKNSP